jgi:hypothetical protein
MLSMLKRHEVKLLRGAGQTQKRVAKATGISTRSVRRIETEPEITSLFGHVDVRFVDGTKKRIHFFASRLKWSRWSQVSIVPKERVEPLVRSLVAHYEAMRGVPLLGVFDFAVDARRARS